MTSPTPPPIFDADELRAKAEAARAARFAFVTSKEAAHNMMAAMLKQSDMLTTAMVLREACTDSVVLALLDERATLLARVEAAERAPGRVDISLLRQAAEKCRDAAPGTPTLQALRHLQGCFGWETVLNLLGHLDGVERKLDTVEAAVERARTDKAQYSANFYDVLVNLIEELEGK